VKAKTFWKTVVADRSDFLERILALLTDNGIKFAVIGGLAVNAYADPLVSLDLDIAVTLDQIEKAEELMRQHFRVERFPFSINVSASDSNLRVQVQTDPRYGDFADRARSLQVLGVDLPVAAIEDVLQGKIWAASDETRRPTKRSKDLLDIARILEVRPDLRDMIPPELAGRLI
jgi:hypothetical protein